MIMQNKPFMVEFLGTPEAGKTTTIHRLAANITNTSSIIQESAEKLPEYFLKGSIESHTWMQLNTLKSILEKVYSSNNPNEICLIDRGIVDTLFWNSYHQKLNHVMSEKLLINTTALKEYNLLPSLLVVLSTTPTEAINRRGGEGRIVTFDFVQSFNRLLLDFIETFSAFVPVYQLDTSGLAPEIVSEKVLTEINKYFSSDYYY